MTKDTVIALQALVPICRELNIHIEADDKLLYMDDQPIGIACNSTYATIMEALGYIFLERYPRFRYDTKIGPGLEKTIKRYWISPEALKKLRESNDKAGT